MCNGSIKMEHKQQTYIYLQQFSQVYLSIKPVTLHSNPKYQKLNLNKTYFIDTHQSRLPFSFIESSSYHYKL